MLTRSITVSALTSVRGCTACSGATPTANVMGETAVSADCVSLICANPRTEGSVDLRSFWTTACSSGCDAGQHTAAIPFAIHEGVLRSPQAGFFLEVLGDDSLNRGDRQSNALRLGDCLDLRPGVVVLNSVEEFVAFGRE